MEKSPKWILCVMLRLIALGATLAAAILMATSRQESRLYQVSYEAKYSDTPAFQYFVFANAIVVIYSALVLFVPPGSKIWKFLVATDWVATMLLISSISAALAIAQLGKNGNYHAGWRPICRFISSFCDHVTEAIMAGFVGVVLYSVVLGSTVLLVLEDDDDCC